MSENKSRKLVTLGELRQDIAPTRDLWPAIATTLATADAVRRPVRRLPRLAWGVAASVALLAVGVWAGRNLLPAPATMAQSPGAAPVAAAPVTMAASFELDPASRIERQRRLDALAGQLAALPPQTQAQVRVSIAAIEKGVRDIQAALGRDPSNLLLQEMLVSSYQEEMRVFGAVDEANRAATGPAL